jgi:hypothetical protein
MDLTASTSSSSSSSRDGGCAALVTALTVLLGVGRRCATSKCYAHKQAMIMFGNHTSWCRTKSGTDPLSGC